MVKKEKDLFKKDLSNKQGSYTKALGDNMLLINDLGNDIRIDLPTYIKKIVDIVKDANDTNAKRNFVLTLTKQRSKLNAMSYVMNAYLKGCGMEVI